MKKLERLQSLQDGAWWDKERLRLEQLWSHEREAFPGWVVGCDEVGRGPLAGPLVAAAAACDQGVHLPGLNDSKKLTPQERQWLAEQIRLSPIRVEVEIISVDVISQGNLHHLSLLAMTRAVKKLKLKPKLILVDGRYPLPLSSQPQRALIKGDSHSALIAAASIVAKVTRDQIMLELAEKYPGYGWEHNVGYPTQEHRQALIKLGATPHHRRNYRPVKAQLPTQLEL